MKKILAVVFFATTPFLSCTQSTTLSEQMKLNFATHLKNIDSSLVLDSFRILQIDTMVEKLGRIIDDTIYKLELHRVQSQLANAVSEQKKDSIPIYQDEINYMIPQIDSVTNSISKGDTKKIYGFVMRCVYQIRKNNHSVKDSIVYFFDNGMNIRNPSFANTDTFISKSLKKIR
jgi:hypothetical protein